MKKRTKRRAKTGIELGAAARALIRLGLDLIVNGISGAQAAFYPNRHPWHQIDLQAANVYKGRAYSEEFAWKVISLRPKISPCKRGLSFSLDTFDLAAAALALRVTGEKRLWEQASEGGKRPLQLLSHSPEVEIAAVLKKLEDGQKRAKNKMERQHYIKQAREWRAFTEWIRYNLLYHGSKQQRALKRGTPSGRRKIAQLRSEFLLKTAKEVLEERTTAQIPEPELRRLVKLARVELQPSRRRHTVSIVDLERDASKAKNFMFEFIKKRHWYAHGKRWELEDFVKQECVLQPAPGSNVREKRERAFNTYGAAPAANMPAKKPALVTTANRLAVIRAASRPTPVIPEHASAQPLGSLKIQSDANTPMQSGSSVGRQVSGPDMQHADDTELSIDSVRASGGPVGSDLSSQTPHASSMIASRTVSPEVRKQFTKQEVIDGIVGWLNRELPQENTWDEVTLRAQKLMIGERPKVNNYRIEEDVTVDRLIQDRRRGSPREEGPFDADYYANWIVRALFLIYDHPNHIRLILREAVDLAWKYRVEQSTIRGKKSTMR